MREIKFRAWDKGNECMIDPNYANISLNGQDLGILDQVYKDEFEIVNKNDFVLEQYTGLKDANGKEIYEGDIIRSNYKYAQPKVSQIVIEDGNSYILGENLATGNEMLVNDHVNEIEIIGNVHANQELLEEKQ